MRLLVGVFVAICLVDAVACGARDGLVSPSLPQLGPLSPGGTLIPLDSGTQWTYEVLDTIVLSGGKPSTASGALTMHVLGDTTIRTLRYAILDGAPNIFGGEINNPHWYFRNKADGFYAAGFIALLPQSEPFPVALPPDFLTLPYPARVGGYYDFGVVSVFSIDTLIAVPAGTFHCLGYLSANGTTRQFVAAGVGLVRQEVYNDAPGTTYHTIYQLIETTAGR